MKKKVLALVMAAAMTFGTIGMSTTAFAAAGKQQIKVTGVGITDNEGNPISGATVGYKQIVEPDPTSVIGWKFVDDVKVDFINGWNGTSASSFDETAENTVLGELVALGVLEDESKGPNGYVTGGDINVGEGSDKYSRALNAVQRYATAPITDSVKFTTGLYVIKAISSGYTYLPMAAYIDTEGTGVDVTAKGAADQVMKVVNPDGQSVQKGETVTYTITDWYPYISPDVDNKFYTITDTLTNAKFSKVEELDVKIGSDTVMKVNPSYDETTNTMTLQLGGENYKPEYAGEKVEISYTAIVQNVEAGELNNKVTSNNPGRETEWTEMSDSVEFTVEKVDKKNETLYLGGAGFTLYEAVSEKTANTITVEIDNKEVYLEKVGEEKFTTTKEEAEADATKTLGYATFSGLDAKRTYYVKETTAPEGYSLNEKYFPLTIESTECRTEDLKDGDGNVIGKKYIFESFNSSKITDTKLSALPSTGGIGTTIFTVGGCAIMIAAAGIFFVSRKKEEEV